MNRKEKEPRLPVQKDPPRPKRREEDPPVREPERKEPDEENPELKIQDF